MIDTFLCFVSNVWFEKKVTFPQSFILFSFKPHHVRPETESMRGKWVFLYYV